MSARADGCQLRDGEVNTVRCGNRRPAVCPSCAKLARKDYQKLIASGFDDVDQQRYRFYFLTLTAPSFGAVHRVPKSDRTGEIRKCRCGKLHDPLKDAGLRGVPIDLDEYDYAGCVRFN